MEAAVDDLVNYTVKHFAHEEVFMESIRYDGIKSHKSIHKSVLEKVGGFASDFKAGDSSMLPEEFFDFLKFWLVSHIRGVDKKYSAPANA